MHCGMFRDSGKENPLLKAVYWIVLKLVGVFVAIPCILAVWSGKIYLTLKKRDKNEH